MQTMSLHRILHTDSGALDTEQWSACGTLCATPDQSSLPFSHPIQTPSGLGDFAFARWRLSGIEDILAAATGLSSSGILSFSGHSGVRYNTWGPLFVAVPTKISKSHETAATDALADPGTAASVEQPNAFH